MGPRRYSLMPVAARGALLPADGGETGEMKGRERGMEDDRDVFAAGAVRRVGMLRPVLGGNALGGGWGCGSVLFAGCVLFGTTFGRRGTGMPVGAVLFEAYTPDAETFSCGPARLGFVRAPPGGGLELILQKFTLDETEFLRYTWSRILDFVKKRYERNETEYVPICARPISYALSKAAMRQPVPVPSVVEKSETTVGTKVLEKDSKLYSLVHVLMRWCNCGNGRRLTTNPNPIRNLRFRTPPALVTSIKPEFFGIHLSPTAARCREHIQQPERQIFKEGVIVNDRRGTWVRGGELTPGEGLLPPTQEDMGVNIPHWFESEVENRCKDNSLEVTKPCTWMFNVLLVSSRRALALSPRPQRQGSTRALTLSGGLFNDMRTSTKILNAPQNPRTSDPTRRGRAIQIEAELAVDPIWSRWPVGIRAGAPSHHQKSAEYGQRGGEWTTYGFGVGGRIRDGHLRGEDGG
ncbi:hypothetical protein B0H11DRAFT_2187853 [Mycena galericulata]|nr:hypothetical protein B0H11DRAFT_2187853 [Mycena galericulata]